MIRDKTAKKYILSILEIEEDKIDFKSLGEFTVQISDDIKIVAKKYKNPEWTYFYIQMYINDKPVSTKQSVSKYCIDINEHKEFKKELCRILIPIKFYNFFRGKIMNNFQYDMKLTHRSKSIYSTGDNLAMLVDGITLFSISMYQSYYYNKTWNININKNVIEIPAMGYNMPYSDLNFCYDTIIKDIIIPQLEIARNTKMMKDSLVNIKKITKSDSYIKKYKACKALHMTGKLKEEDNLADILSV
jgi:hypothetical protein